MYQAIIIWKYKNKYNKMSMLLKVGDKCLNKIAHQSDINNLEDYQTI